MPLWRVGSGVLRLFLVYRSHNREDNQERILYTSTLCMNLDKEYVGNLHVRAKE
jgi:hypothetical protein